MNKDKKIELGITVKKDQDFSEWYTQVVQKAELADYSTVKGCMIIRANAYSIWEKIQEYLNKKIKKIGVKNAYFPLFIPESFFKKESEHAKGFTPEVAWIANTEEGERLAIRPTSETIMYDSYSRWIRSHRDLPLRINQWCNIVRWETKATRLFLRTREFLWQEGHCVYETKEECDKETLEYLKEYKNLCEELLALPVLIGKKSESEKFAGALYTLSVEGVMPDGKGLQMGTSHNLGQGFAKAFGIRFLGEDGKEHIPWQNSWGVSTRLIGALVMVHGDDKGMVIPPRAAENKAVIVPILTGDNEKVLKRAKEVFRELGKFNAILDDREGYTPGWKFNDWELKGIPLRIEIGPRDIEKKQIVLVRRDNYEKMSVKDKNLSEEVERTLDLIQENLFNRAKKLMDSKIASVKNKNEFKKAIENKMAVKAYWCGNSECEKIVKNEFSVKSLNMPLDQPKNIKENCFCCGKKANVICYFAKSY